MNLDAFIVDFLLLMMKISLTNFVPVHMLHSEIEITP